MESRNGIQMNLLQGRNRGADVENGLVNTEGKNAGEQIERVALIYTH